MASLGAIHILSQGASVGVVLNHLPSAIQFGSRTILSVWRCPKLVLRPNLAVPARSRILGEQYLGRSQKWRVVLNEGLSR